MIHKTPVQDEKVERSDWPTIRSAYTNYDATFVILHPFLLIKPNCDIVFEFGNWPNKAKINICTEPISWSSILEQAELKDLSELDRLLAYLHCARRTADRLGWLKLSKLISKQNFITAEVDSLPEILINPIFEAFRDLGHPEIKEYSEFGEFKTNHVISDVLSNTEQSFYAHAKIATCDKEIIVATDFDQCFSYLSSSRHIIEYIVDHAKLEGFFCNDSTRPDWSNLEQTDNLINWSSPERRINYT